MSELELYKWVNNWNPEWRWDTNESKEEDVIIWISVHALESFLKLMPVGLFDEGGISARIVDMHIAIWMSEICDYLGIALEKIFPKE